MNWLFQEKLPIYAGGFEVSYYCLIVFGEVRPSLQSWNILLRPNVEIVMSRVWIVRCIYLFIGNSGVIPGSSRDNVRLNCRDELLIPFPLRSSCHHHRLTYWVVFAAFSILEAFVSVLLLWIPFYFALKLAFLTWCFHPQTQVGSSHDLHDFFLWLQCTQGILTCNRRRRSDIHSCNFGMWGLNVRSFLMARLTIMVTGL